MIADADVGSHIEKINKKVTKITKLAAEAEDNFKAGIQAWKDFFTRHGILTLGDDPFKTFEGDKKKRLENKYSMFKKMFVVHNKCNEIIQLINKQKEETILQLITWRKYRQTKFDKLMNFLEVETHKVHAFLVMTENFVQEMKVIKKI